MQHSFLQGPGYLQDVGGWQEVFDGLITNILTTGPTCPT